MVDVANAVVIFACSCKITRKVTKLVDNKLDILDSSKNTFYRGITNFNFKLIPSIYRNLNTNNDFKLIDYYALRDLYKKSELITKYEKVFGNGNINYDFCAFSQHSKSYSPLIDFTEDAKIALSFATNNVNTSINDYNRTDAGIFALEIKDIITKDHISFFDNHVFVSDEKLHFNAILGGKRLYYCTYKDFDIEVYLIKDKTNDRMKYQKGCFLYFKKAVIVNGNLLMPINSGRIRKYKIDANNQAKFSKKDIYKYIIDNYHQYRYEYLMDPYKYFEEAPF